MESFSPVWIIFHDLTTENSFLRIFLVPDLEPSNVTNCFCFERYVICVLIFCVYVLDDNIDGLSDIALFEIDVPQQINILKNLWRLETVREDLMRGQRCKEIRVGCNTGECGAQKSYKER